MTKSIKVELSYCRECGVDTRIEGIVNRVPFYGEKVDMYTCGPCMDTLDSSIEDSWDIDRFNDYLIERIEYVDSKYPQASRIRELLETVSDIENVNTYKDIEPVLNNILSI